MTICDGLGAFIRLKGDILMSLFLQTFPLAKFCGVPKCPSLHLRKDDKKEAKKH